jgi:hypothetical protein
MTGSDSKDHRRMRRGEVLFVDWEKHREANNRQLTQSEETEGFKERPMMVTRGIAKLSVFVRQRASNLETTRCDCPLLE